VTLHDRLGGMEFNINEIDSKMDPTTPYHKDYLFQVLKNAVMCEGTQVII